MNDICALALDVDGVLTDGTFWWTAGGEEAKRFSFRDIMGLSLARRAGLHLALISGEEGPLIERLATKLAVEDVFSGCRDKARALADFAERHGITLAQICYIGDDVNDLPALRIAGLAVAPSDAHRSIREAVHLVTRRAAGRGAVREVVDTLLERGAGHQGGSS